jgi:drug/metabolite transporter (DMT)-like permease
VLLPANLLGIGFALLSALVWGGGDFSGGFSARRSGQYAVVAISGFSGILVLAVGAVLWRESFPSTAGTVWAMLAGVAGAVGLTSLYRALSIGQAASVAPTAAVIGAALPVGFGILTQGAPEATRLAGFALALAGIWLVSQTPGGGRTRLNKAFLLACLAGLAFGGFFILIAQVEPGIVFTPLIVERCVILGIALLLSRRSGQTLPSLRANPVAWLAGVLDAGGNIFYLLARQYTRLDVAAVLSSLYPAITVLLAAMLLKEKVSRTQALGVAVCLAAIMLITL